jgi:hypothetical protein
LENGPSAKAGIQAGIGFYMLIEQNYLDVSYPVIVFFSVKENRERAEPSIEINENQKSK